jgi:hypothetical protein
MQTFSGLLMEWLPEPEALSAECRPKAPTGSPSEALPGAFGKVHLLDPDDVRQHLLDQRENVDCHQHFPTTKTCRIFLPTQR